MSQIKSLSEIQLLQMHGSVIPTASDVERPYPRRCFACGKDSVNQTRIPYDAKVRHDGKLHAFHIPSLQIDQCDHCGEQYFTSVTDDQIHVGLRKHLGLLTVDEIRAGIEKCGVSQKVFAEHLGIAAETVSRWLNDGATQTRSLDKLMRLYFSMLTVRAALANPDFMSASTSVPEVGVSGVRPEFRRAMAQIETIDVQPLPCHRTGDGSASRHDRSHEGSPGG